MKFRQNAVANVAGKKSQYRSACITKIPQNLCNRINAALRADYHEDLFDFVLFSFPASTRQTWPTIKVGWDSCILVKNKNKKRWVVCSFPPKRSDRYLPLGQWPQALEYESVQVQANRKRLQRKVRRGQETASALRSLWVSMNFWSKP